MDRMDLVEYEVRRVGRDYTRWIGDRTDIHAYIY